MPNDIEPVLAGQRVSEFARPAQTGEQAPTRGLAEGLGDVTVKTGGLDYSGPCTRMTRAGAPCRGHAGSDGLCAAHRERDEE